MFFRSFTKFTGKQLFQSLFVSTLLKRRLWHKCFPVNFVKFLRTSFLYKTSGGCFCILKDFQIKNTSSQFRSSRKDGERKSDNWKELRFTSKRKNATNLYHRGFAASSFFYVIFEAVIKSKFKVKLLSQIEMFTERIGRGTQK